MPRTRKNVLTECPPIQVYPDLFDMGYGRVSTNRQGADDRVSLPLQSASIRALAARNGRTLDDRFIMLERHSARTAERRAVFMHIEAICRANPRTAAAPGYIYFLNDDRFGRFIDFEEATYWRVHFRKNYGWKVVYVQDGDLKDSLAASMIRSVKSATASQYSNDLSRRTHDAKRATAEMGFWNGPAPLGYRRAVARPGESAVVLEAGQAKAQDQRTRLVPGPKDEVDLVATIFARYATGCVSLTSLARELSTDPRWRDTLAWSPQCLGKMLRSPTYLGYVVFGERPVGEDGVQRGRSIIPPKIVEVRTTLPQYDVNDPHEDLHIWVRGAHPALVSRKTYDAVRSRLAANGKMTRAVDGAYPFSGMFSCAECGQPYTGGGGPKNKKDPSDPHRYRFYKDRGGTGIRPVCGGPVGTLQQRLVEPLIVSALARVIGSDQVMRAIDAAIDRKISEVRAVVPASSASNTRERAKLAKEKERLLDAVQIGTITADEAKGRLATIRGKLEALDAPSELPVTAVNREHQLATLRRTLKDRARDFHAQAAVLTGAELREVCAPWIEHGVVDKTNRTLTVFVRRVPGNNPLLHLETLPEQGSP